MLTAATYEWAYRILSQTLSYANMPETIRLVSGGAAWADHLAVTAFLRGIVPALTIHLPVEIRGDGELGAWSRDAETWTRLHRQFSDTLGRNTMAELDEARARGAVVTGDAGFKARNARVARVGGGMIAFTLGPVTRLWWPGEPGFQSADAAGIPAGGTAHTWGLTRGVGWKIHQSMREFWG